MEAETHRTGLVPVLLEMLGDLPAIAERMATSIRRELPEYVAVPFAEHVSHVQEQQSHQIRALLERRLPDRDDLRRARELGRRRAAQGLPVQSVIGAFHVGNQELWQLLRERVRDDRLLTDVPEVMWKTVHQMTSALAAAHAEASRAMHARQITMRYRLFELLLDGSADEEAAEVAIGLGLGLEDQFLAACATSGPSSAYGLDALQRRLDRGRGTAYVGRVGRLVMVLGQATTAQDMIDALQAHAGADAVGIGLARAGLPGAVATLRDARWALAAAEPKGGVRFFERDWLQACLLAEQDRLRPLVERSMPTARANAHLTATVTAFVDADFSISATAQHLDLHANTVAYRLERWKALTGWDVRTFDGLLLSLLASWIVTSGP